MEKNVRSQPKENKVNQQKINKPNKSKKSKTPRIPNTIPKKDHCQRVTYLYKIGSMMASNQLYYNKTESNKSIDSLSRMYLNHMDLVSKKAVLKLHPDIKRTICKKCSRLQIDGYTTTTRIINESNKQLPHCNILEKKCVCGQNKRFPIGKDEEYILFSEKDSVLYEIENKKMS